MARIDWVLFPVSFSRISSQGSSGLAAPVRLQLASRLKAVENKKMIVKVLNPYTPWMKKENGAKCIDINKVIFCFFPF